MSQQPATPLYDIDLSWEENAQEGPFFESKIPPRETLKATGSFLGHPIASPIGVAAGPLLNSRWTGLAGQLGFDIITYKTIRSRPHPSHPLPNVIFVEHDGALFPGPEAAVTKRGDKPSAPSQLGITNSFGMPSRGPGFLIYDIHRAKTLLENNQVLVVSVVGTDSDARDFGDDFAMTAKIAIQGGAHVIEVNFSCPNVKSGEGSLYLDPKMVEAIGQKVVRSCKKIPVVMKVGTFPSTEALRETLLAAANVGIRGVCGINSVIGKVTQNDGKPALGPDRLTSGICGAPILEAAVAFIREAREIIDREKLTLTLMGVGGVTRAADFSRLLESGADITLTATGMMFNPLLAYDYHKHEAAVVGSKRYCDE